MNLASLLPEDAVLPHLEARDKKQALKMLAAYAAPITGLAERDIYNALLNREQIGCTGMGSGVCIPHGRFEELKKAHAFFARLDTPIEFGAADHMPVDLIFLLLTPTDDNTAHLKALATISRHLRDKRLRENLRATDNASVMHSLLIQPRDDDER